MSTRSQGQCTARFDVLSPLAKIAVQGFSGAQALADLSGKTVCELWDFIFRGDIIYPEIRAHLRARYPGIKFIDPTEFGNVHGPRQREIVATLGDKLRELKCDAVICGIGA